MSENIFMQFTSALMNLHNSVIIFVDNPSVACKNN